MVRFIIASITSIFMLLATEFVLADSERPAIPLHSHLIPVNGHQLHIHQKGKNLESPLLILLSGPTDNWHSDSAWWILAQNYLSNDFQTMAVDRAGQAWSSRIKQPSYRQFSQDLQYLLSNDDFIQKDREVVFVAFASSNLSLHLLLQNPGMKQRTKGVVLIDPDVLTQHSVEHYTGETEQYRAGWEGLESYIRAGKYDSRIKEKTASEREHLEQLIPEKYMSLMDWDYYDAVETIRTTREYQIHKFLEASVYKDDLAAAKEQALDKKLPLVIIDTDFESAYLETIEDEKVTASIVQWRQEGIEWYFDLAQKSRCGAYWPVDTQEHLLMMTQPELIEQAINKVLACSK
jgi:pimeloyl-ACP methyl ester carboxylesterase